MTHAHPWAHRREISVKALAGEMNRMLEEAKAKRYGPGSGGVSVTPAAVESFGKIGPCFEWLLRKLAAISIVVQGKHSGSTGAIYQRWLAELGVSRVRAMRRNFVLAAGANEHAKTDQAKAQQVAFSGVVSAAGRVLPV